MTTEFREHGRRIANLLREGKSVLEVAKECRVTRSRVLQVRSLLAKEGENILPPDYAPKNKKSQRARYQNSPDVQVGARSAAVREILAETPLLGTAEINDRLKERGLPNLPPSSIRKIRSEVAGNNVVAAFAANVLCPNDEMARLTQLRDFCKSNGWDLETLGRTFEALRNLQIG